MSEIQQLRSEFRADLRDIKSDLNLAVARIEHSLEHTETTIMQRMTQQENRIMSNLNPIAEWRIEAEKRLAEHTQATRIISAIFGSAFMSGAAGAFASIAFFASSVAFLTASCAFEVASWACFCMSFRGSLGLSPSPASAIEKHTPAARMRAVVRLRSMSKTP
jgi:hypothetical protein